MRRSCAPVVPALAAAAALLATAATASAQITDRQDLVAALDSAAGAHAADSTVAGVAVAVVQGTDTLLLDGFGYADLEFDVPTPPDAVYEIGSVTKQFTAAAVLQLVEAGSIDLDADVTDYLPDFGTRGHRVPVRRLLDHTSGIRSYTSMTVFGDLVMKELPRDTLVSLIASEPFDFEPGSAMIYNNSAYFLLGLIIEEVSGQPYEEYVAEHLFGPAGMRDSYYCDARATVRHRAHGYAWRGPEEGLRRKSYLDHTWPYAAGSLCSSAGDLVAWNRTLHGGHLLDDASYETMTSPGTLSDGTRLRYAMGLSVHDARGHRVMEHGGGINGFLTQNAYYPDDDLHVVVLQNSTGPTGPGDLAESLARLVLGPGEVPEAVAYSGELAPLTGRYSGRARGRTLTLRVEADSAGLRVWREGSDDEGDRLEHLDGQTWRDGASRFTFVWAGEDIVELRLDQIGGHYVLRRIGGG